MKILFVIPSNLDSKGKNSYSSFIENEIDSITRYNDFVESRCFFITSRMSPFKILRSIMELKQIIRDYQPDLIHSQVGSITSFIAAKSKGKIPLITTFGGSDLLGLKRNNTYWKIRSKLSRMFSDYSANKSDGIICVSLSLFNNLGVKEKKKAVVIPRGIDLEFFKPIEFRKARTKMGWSLDEKVVLFNHSNASSYVKNLPLAIESINQLNEEYHINARLEILENMSKEDVMMRMNATNLLLVTSFHEGSPNIVKESMACNLPIVSVDVGDVSERIKNCSISSIVSYNSSHIAKLLNKVLIKNERSNGRDLILRDGISNVKTSKNIVEYYKEFLK